MVGSKNKSGSARLSRTAGYRRFRWTEKLAALLGVLPDAAVAAKAGMDRQTVAAERRRRGIEPARPRRPRVEWTDEMIACLGTDSDAAVAGHLGIHPASVTYKRLRLGIPPANPPWHEKAPGYPWQPEELALLGKLSDGELARTLGLATGTVTRKRQRLGIAPFQPPPPPIEWTPAMIERLGQAPDARVAGELGISPRSVRDKRQSLGIPATLDNRPVERNEEVVELLSLPNTEVVHRTGINWRTVQRLRDDLGIQEPEAPSPERLPETAIGGGDAGGAAGEREIAASPQEWRAKYRWRPGELALLGSCSATEVALLLGRTVGAVRARRQALDILNRRVRSWLPLEIEQLGTAPDSEIAERLGRSAQAVGHRRRRLGFPAFGRSASLGRPRGRPPTR